MDLKGLLLNDAPWILTAHLLCAGYNTRILETVRLLFVALLTQDDLSM